MEPLVRSFCKDFEPADEAVLTYVVSVIDDLEEDEADLEKIEDVFSGFFPAFAALPKDDRHQKIWNLVQKSCSCRHSRENGEHDKQSASSSYTEPDLLLRGLSLKDETGLPSQRTEAVIIMQSCQEELAAPPDWRPSVDLGADHAAVDTLSSLWPAEISCCPEFVKHILHAKGLGSVETAANWLLEIDPSELEQQQQLWIRAFEKEQNAREAALQADKDARKKTLARFSLQPETGAAPSKVSTKQSQYVEPWTAAQKTTNGSNGVRYRDGRLVSTRGEKYVVEQTGADWDGGSKGKVMTKGKRGKGFV